MTSPTPSRSVDQKLRDVAEFYRDCDQDALRVYVGLTLSELRTIIRRLDGEENGPVSTNRDLATAQAELADLREKLVVVSDLAHSRAAALDSVLETNGQMRRRISEARAEISAARRAPDADGPTLDALAAILAPGTRNP